VNTDGWATDHHLVALQRENSLVAGNLAGNSRENAPPGRFATEFLFRYQFLAGQIPYSAEQGILLDEQGILRAHQGIARLPATSRNSCIHRVNCGRSRGVVDWMT
jgi:hypothetical protein